jgi:hypothetical protein
MNCNPEADVDRGIADTDGAGGTASPEPARRRAFLTAAGLAGAAGVAVPLVRSTDARAATASPSLTAKSALSGAAATAAYLPLPTGTPTTGDAPVVTSTGSDQTTWTPVAALDANGLVPRTDLPNAAVYSPLSYGATGDGTTADDTAIADAIAAIPSTGGILDLSGAPIAYAIEQPIQLKSGISVQGKFLNGQNIGTGAVKADVVCVSTFSGLACVADAGALGTGDVTGPTDPLTIRGLSIDMTNVPSGQTPDGIRLMTWRAIVEGCFIRGSANSGSGIHITDVNADGNGFPSTVGAPENAIRNNWVVAMAGTGVLVDRTNSNQLTDGFCVGNVVVMTCTNVSSGAYSSSGAAIDIECCADWQVYGNHVYDVPGDAIVLNHAWVSFICHNKVDKFGQAGEGITYRGIWVNGASGPGFFLSDNEVDTDEQFGASTTVMNYIEIDGGAGQTSIINMSGTSIHKTGNNPLVGTSTAFSVNGGGGMTLTDHAFSTVATGTGTTTPSPAVTISGGTVTSLLRTPLPAVAYSNPGQPNGTVSLTGVMAGIGSTATYTPALTGNLLIRITGLAGTATAVSTVGLQGRYGTSPAPKNGDGLTGTTFGPAITCSAQAATTTGTCPFTLEAKVTGLTIGTEYWVDFSFLTGNSKAQANASGIGVVIEEVN